MIEALFRLWRHQGGGISVIIALVLPAFIGTLGLGIEVSYWLLHNRSLQNAADSAVIAASQAGSTGYVAQARAVTRQYGLVDGSNGVTVTASNAATCPAGGTNCYSVTIVNTVPTHVGALVNYLGTATVGGVKSTRISAMAIASPGAGAGEYCLVALSTAPGVNAIIANGAPKADLTGCGVRSNTGMRCDGQDLKASFGDAGGTNNGCGAVTTSNVPTPFSDPFAARAASLPADACGGSYPKVGSPTSTRWTGARTLTSTTTICGDLQLTGNVTITAPSDAVLIIRNGQLATNNFTLRTAAGSGLAIVFTGTNNASHSHIPSGKGGLDITAPTSGTWAGVALYQDPALTVNVAMPDAASEPTWAFSGLIYLPKVDLSFSGSTGKATSGATCTVIVANTVSVNGTALVLSTSQCAAAGLTTPTNGAAGRGVLAG